MTLEKCAAFCSTYKYFGTQWNRECWCGDTLTAGSVAAPLSDCNYPCTGDATEMCGGSRRLSLYHDTTSAPPTAPGGIGSYAPLGCYTDKQTDRTLTAGLLRSSSMTIATCATFCSGHKYFGTEWGIECWCGDVLSGSSAAVGASQCSMACGGSIETCGNADRLSVYQLSAT